MMNFKFKKSLSAAVVVLSLLVSAQSAFAVKGLGDAESSPIYAAPNTHYTFPLQRSADDVDWFVYTNNTSSSVTINASMTPPSGQNYNLDAFWYINGSDKDRTKLAVNDNGVGKKDSFILTNLKPGEKITFRIYSATGTVSTSGYDFYFTAN